MAELLDTVPLLGWWSMPLAYGLTALVIVALWWAYTRRLRPMTQGLLVLGGVAVGTLAWLVVDVWWQPVAEGLGAYVWLWTGIIGFVALQCVARPRRPAGAARRRLRWVGVLVGAVVALLVVVLAGLVAVNAHFAAYRSLGAALGVGRDVTTLTDLGAASVDPASTRTPGPLTASWRAPAGMPLNGRVVAESIPASDPHFQPRQARVYLPPAYLTADRPLLPVLVLMAGQPGNPEDWLWLGRIRESMDTYAAAHDGLAPVVVIPDPLGNPAANPLCSDAHLGNVATYLEKDVPAWITEHLQVDTDPRRWAVAGISNGGTCALQVVTRAPQTYSTFLDRAGEEHPTLGSEERTIAEGFGGDRTAYEANDPLTLLVQRRYEGVAGVFSAGDDDTEIAPGLRRVEAAARAAGMQTEFRTYPGQHSWSVWAVAMADQVTWLGDRLGITA